MNNQLQRFLRLLDLVPSEHRGIFVTETYLNSLPEPVRIAVIAMATHDYFDRETLMVGCPQYSDWIEDLYLLLQELPIIEEFPDRGFNVHELTREHIDYLYKSVEIALDESKDLLDLMEVAS
jgi:hypothetical protein